MIKLSLERLRTHYSFSVHLKCDVLSYQDTPKGETARRARYALLKFIVVPATTIVTNPIISSNPRFMFSMKMNEGFPSKVIMPSANMRAPRTVSITPPTNPPILIPTSFVATLSPLPMIGPLSNYSAREIQSASRGLCSKVINTFPLACSLLQASLLIYD